MSNIEELARCNIDTRGTFDPFSQAVNFVATYEGDVFAQGFSDVEGVLTLITTNKTTQGAALLRSRFCNALALHAALCEDIAQKAHEGMS